MILENIDSKWILNAANKGNSYSQLHLSLICMISGDIPRNFLVDINEDVFLKMKPRQTRWSKHWLQESINSGNNHAKKINQYLS